MDPLLDVCTEWRLISAKSILSRVWDNMLMSLDQTYFWSLRVLTLMGLYYLSNSDIPLTSHQTGDTLLLYIELGTNQPHNPSVVRPCRGYPRIGVKVKSWQSEFLSKV